MTITMRPRLWWTWPISPLAKQQESTQVRTAGLLADCAARTPNATLLGSSSLLVEILMHLNKSQSNVQLLRTPPTCSRCNPVLHIFASAAPKHSFFCLPAWAPFTNFKSLAAACLLPTNRCKGLCIRELLRDHGQLRTTRCLAVPGPFWYDALKPYGSGICIHWPCGQWERATQLRKWPERRSTAARERGKRTSPSNAGRTLDKHAKPLAWPGHRPLSRQRRPVRASVGCRERK